MNLLNLGCGKRFHKDWTNLDFRSDNRDVIEHNLLNGIPFKDNSFDVVYHSHVLEHFARKDAVRLIQECFRVLKPYGILRLAVPDLEMIAKEYLHNLERAINNEPCAEFDYDWILLEMYDQTVRNTSGGEIANYLFRKDIPNEEYLFNRIGDEGKNLHKNYLNSLNNKFDKQINPVPFSIKIQAKRLYQRVKNVLTRTIFRTEYEVLREESEALQIGRFRLSGEVHQHMYDRYSLGKLLSGCGFINIKVVSSVESDIIDWNVYQLDSLDGNTLKPDSLFVEAIK
jgi:SAM-dependent methyltransferase